MSKRKREATQSNRERKLQQEQLNSKKKQRNLIISMIVIAVAVIGIAVLIATNSQKDADKASGISFPYDNQPKIGSDDAPIKMVEMGDFKCPTCGYFAQSVYPLLKQNYIDKGIVQFYFMNFSFIPNSGTAAMAARAVYHQNNDSFWPYYDAIYSNQGDEKTDWATPDFLVNLAKQHVPEIDADLLSQDIRQQKYASEVQEEFNFVRSAGVTSTPTVFINGKKVNGFTYDALEKAINAELEGQE